MKAREKYLKHYAESTSTLTNNFTPYKAFLEGSERAIASYIKLGQEDRIKSEIIAGPILKSQETQLVESLIKNLLKDFNSVKFINKDNQCFAILEGQIYHFSNLLKLTNFNHLTLSLQELDAYHQLLDSGNLSYLPSLPELEGRPTEEDFAKADPDQLCSSLTLAEKEAINIYTGDFHTPLNNLLRGMMTKEVMVNQDHIKGALLHVAVAITGLNKLPDYQPSIGSDNQRPKYLYRVETHLPDPILNKRKWAVLKGGGITTEMGFISTSFLKPAFSFSHANSVGILIKNLKGKIISPLSQCPGEREVLLPPTQIQWLYCKTILHDVGQTQIPIFIAKPVSVPSELSLDYQKPLPEEWIVKNLDSLEPLLENDVEKRMI